MASEQALPVWADAVFELLLAGRMAEICRRSAYVVDIALKVLLFCDQFGFFQE